MLRRINHLLWPRCGTLLRTKACCHRSTPLLNPLPTPLLNPLPTPLLNPPPTPLPKPLLTPLRTPLLPLPTPQEQQRGPLLNPPPTPLPTPLLTPLLKPLPTPLLPRPPTPLHLCCRQVVCGCGDEVHRLCSPRPPPRTLRLEMCAYGHTVVSEHPDLQHIA
jgi:hypothetical protein